MVLAVPKTEVLFATHKQLHIHAVVVVLNMVIVVELLLTVELDVRAVATVELGHLVLLHLLQLNLLQHLLVLMVVAVQVSQMLFVMQTVNSEAVVQLLAGVVRLMLIVCHQMVVKADVEVLSHLLPHQVQVLEQLHAEMVVVDRPLLELLAILEVLSVDAVLLEVGVVVQLLIVFQQMVVRMDVPPPQQQQQDHHPLQQLVENQLSSQLEEVVVEVDKQQTVHVVLQMVIPFVEHGLKVVAALSMDSVVIPQDIVVLVVKVVHVLGLQFNKLQDLLQLLQIQIQVLLQLLVKLVSLLCTPVLCKMVVSSSLTKLRIILKSG